MKHKVAVYGSLLHGLSNNSLLVHHKAKLLGEFETKPEFTMISLGGFPGVVKNGKTSIHTEVYEVDEDCLQSLDSLEGYQKDRKGNFYNRETIKTCFGETFIYLYNYTLSSAEDGQNIVKDGNWRRRMHGSIG